MHWPFAQPQCCGRCRCALRNLALHILGESRRCDIDRLLKERAIERIRLVKQREHLEAAMVEESFKRNLEARDEILDQESLGLYTLLERVEQFAEPIDRRRKLSWRIGAHHTTAPR